MTRTTGDEIRFLEVDYSHPDLRPILELLPPTIGATKRGLDILTYNYIAEQEDDSLAWDEDPFGPRYHSRITRFISRMTAFTITLRSTERILEKSFNLFIERLFEKDFLEYDEKWLKKSQLLSKDLKKWKTLRDKILAHPSFIDPNHSGGRDSESLQLTSLDYLAGSLIGGSKNSYYLGGSWRKYEHDTPSDAKDANLDKCGIVRDYPNIKRHFNLWNDLFLAAINQCNVSSATGQ